MGNLHKQVKKYQKYSLGAKVAKGAIGEESYNSLHVLGEQAEASYDAKKDAEKALKDAEENPEPVVPLPDEEALERVRRRRNARRGSGRASTVLSDDARYGG